MRRLRSEGLLRSRSVRRALASLPRWGAAPKPLRPFAFMDTPWPDPRPGGYTLSPSLTTLLVELLEPRPAKRFLIAPASAGMLPALLERMGCVVVAQDDRPVDGAVLVDPGPEDEERVGRRLREGAFMLIVRLAAGSEDLTKTVRSRDGFARLGLSGFVLPGIGGPGARRTIQDRLVTEGIQRRVWTEEPGRKEDDYFREVVLRTWDPPAAHVPEQIVAHHVMLARKFFHLGYVSQRLGDATNAEEFYSASLRVFPTAEAYTFRGWVRASQGQNSAAVRDCLRAIENDPEFGNPYNDLAAYLLEDGRAEDALAWLNQAKAAPRYAARQYAYLNSGRACLMLGNREQARRDFETALELEPGYEAARRYLDLLARPGSGRNGT